MGLDASFLPIETQKQVRKNELYLEYKNKVRSNQRNKLYSIIMKYGVIPKITQTGFIIWEEK